MKTKINFEWQDNWCNCFIEQKDCLFFGVSHCSEEDKDKFSKLFGERLALMRASLDKIKRLINSEIIPELKALKHLQSCIQQSKQYNPNNYESKMIKKQIWLKEQELKETKQLKEQIETDIAEYIQAKYQTK